MMSPDFHLTVVPIHLKQAGMRQDFAEFKQGISMQITYYQQSLYFTTLHVRNIFVYTTICTAIHVELDILA